MNKKNEAPNTWPESWKTASHVSVLSFGNAPLCGLLLVCYHPFWGRQINYRRSQCIS